jgi:ribosomal protein S6--L-glutamate ligase
MKLLIIGPVSEENLSLVSIASGRGHEVSLLSVEDIGFYIANDKIKALISGIESPVYDCCLFRVVGNATSTVKAFVRLLKQEGTTIVDDIMDKETFGGNKLFTQVLYQLNDIPVIETYYLQNIFELEKIKDQLPEPALVKESRGKRSRNIFLLENREAILNFFKREKFSFFKREKKFKISDFLIQRVIDAKECYRIFVVGDNVLGVMKRISYLNSDRSKVSRKDRSTKGELTAELRELALKSSKVASIEIAGVDIIYDGEKPLILEVNRAPMFTRFTKVMGVNVAEEIIKYLEKKTNK